MKFTLQIFKQTSNGFWFIANAVDVADNIVSKERERYSGYQCFINSILFFAKPKVFSELFVPLLYIPSSFVDLYDLFITDA